ncbi:MAG: aminoacyl-tRNA hydrolase [Actinobacteria bacterium]|nr:aminoacyl-tRNA hydrolase [Actinomycetota bacterium]
MNSPGPWLIAGLGNPGKEYAATRHNIGYMVLDLLAERMGERFTKHRRAHADTAEGRLDGVRVVLVRSRTYMNESGAAIRAAADYSSIPLSNIIVIHDELDIDFDAIKIKVGGGDGGHNGIKSTKKSLASGDFFRVRVGIGRPPGRQDPADYVLRSFSSSERKELPSVVDSAADAVEAIVTEGLAVAQNRYHSK